MVYYILRDSESRYVEERKVLVVAVVNCQLGVTLGIPYSRINPLHMMQLNLEPLVLPFVVASELF